MNNPDVNHYVIVGKLGKTYGIKGWIKIQSFTDPVDNILDYQPWYLGKNGKWQCYDNIDCQIQGNAIIAHIEGFDSPEHAKQLAGLEIAVLREQLPKLPKGQYYLNDLVGLEVFNSEGAIGKVERVMDNSAHPILVVSPGEVLIPLVMQKIVLAVDLEAKKIIVEWDIS